ncbi:hypothetical protein GGS20DRAFT_557123 [Poronia punctata]|nr:hypothetical protein GGS20DRAFT_557123 [Poronia punctata]
MQGNGSAAAAGAMAVGPTPAGHQAELNLIYGMVEELSRQLADNRRMTEDIVSGLGRVRNRAHERGLANDDLLEEATDELFAQEPNLEAMVSVLTEALDRAKQSRDSNFSLLITYAKVFENIINQFHAYKQKHVTDIAAWHRSYRAQLAEARAENCRLREQMWEMQEHASRANDLLRNFGKKLDEDPARWEKRVSDIGRRQEVRFWKRMAFPEIAQDDPFWSDDDDIIDPAEKERLKEQRELAEQLVPGMPGGSHSEGSDGGNTQVSYQSHSMANTMGGVAMEREGSIQNPPSRPASTGSTGGRSS